MNETTPVSWRGLALMSVTDPAQAARNLMALPLRRPTLWTGLALAAVLNTLVFSLTNLLIPAATPLPWMMSAPLAFLALVAGGLVLTVYALYWAGRLLGGKAALEDVMVLVLWLQLLRIAVQLATLLLLLTVPLLAFLLVMTASLIGVYITLHFVNQAHRLNSLLRAGGVLVAAVLAMAVALYIFLALFGHMIPGSSLHV